MRTGAQWLRHVGHQPRWAIRLCDTGFELYDEAADPEPGVAIAWAEIQEVWAFKRDAFTVDQICLAIVLSNERGVELNEEMGGWDTLVQAIPAYLRDHLPFEAWFLRVAFPAFEPNRTLLYRRE